MENVRTSVAAQSAALTTAADEILAEPKVEPRRFVPLSARPRRCCATGSDFIPSWAGAMSIDLLPVVLVLVLMIVHDAMRREANSMEEAETITAAEMMRADRALTGRCSPNRRRRRGGGRRRSRRSSRKRRRNLRLNPRRPVAEPAADATVTPIDVRKRGEGPQRA